MSRSARFFLLVITPALAILLALLGVATIRSNPLGWFLFVSWCKVGLIASSAIRLMQAIS
jgi:hypothetical protein